MARMLFTPVVETVQEHPARGQVSHWDGLLTRVMEAEPARSKWGEWEDQTRPFLQLSEKDQ